MRNRHRSGVVVLVHKPLALNLGVLNLIPGSSNLSNETLKPWPCLHMSLAVGRTLNINSQMRDIVWARFVHPFVHPYQYLYLSDLCILGIYDRSLVKGAYPLKYFYFSTKIYVVGALKNRLNETVLLSTQNMCLI